MWNRTPQRISITPKGSRKSIVYRRVMYVIIKVGTRYLPNKNLYIIIIET